MREYKLDTIKRINADRFEAEVDEKENFDIEHIQGLINTYQGMVDKLKAIKSTAEKLPAWEDKIKE